MKQKRLLLWKLMIFAAITIIFVSVLLSVILLGQGKSGEGNAFSSSNTSSYVSVGELLNDPNSAIGSQPFNKNAVTTLLNMICGNAGEIKTQMANLRTRLSESSSASEPNAISAADLRAKTYLKSSDKSIVVRLGGLDWIVTFVSTDQSNKNLIATLWLSNNHQTAWSGVNNNLGTYYGFVSGGLYSDWSADWSSSTVDSYPSNMYGTSYVRVETLNNPLNRTYATSNSALVRGSVQSSDHVFALYTVASRGLTQYLTTPNKMKWMTYMQDPSIRNSSGSYISNEALTGTDMYGYSSTWSDESYNYASYTGYANWGEDYLFLPSMGEVGCTDEYDGLWETNAAERSIYDGSSSTLTASASQLGVNNNNYGTTAYVRTWYRSACSDTAGSCCGEVAAGSGTNNVDVTYSRAVRPALLLNLTEVVNSFGNEITFDQQGGTGGTSDMLIAKGESFPQITAPTRTGYSFAGYYTLPNGTGTKIYNSDGTAAIETSTFTSATILYAYWLWYDIKNVSGSTTSCVVFEDSDKNICNASLMIYPESGHVVSKFSFDGSTWFVVNSCQKSVSNLSLAAGVIYYASEGTNSFVLDFKGIARNCGVIDIYLHTVAGSYSGLKAAGGAVFGVAVQATKGGVAYVVGADLDTLGDDDEVIVAADIVQPGYAFCYWQDSDGNILSYDQSVKFKKSEVMDLAITAVFMSMSDSNVSLETDNT